ncbi:MAG: hypothetical protein RH981_18940 [Arenibacter sp.]
MNKNNKSETKIHISPLIKWLLFIPSILFLLAYLVGMAWELIARFKKVAPLDTVEDVNNARKWFIYMNVPFFTQNFVLSEWNLLSLQQKHAINRVYGVRRYSRWFKMYFPASPHKLNFKEQFKLRYNTEVLLPIE